MTNCHICKRPMGDPDDPWSRNCGAEWCVHNPLQMIAQSAALGLVHLIFVRENL